MNKITHFTGIIGLSALTGCASLQTILDRNDLLEPTSEQQELVRIAFENNILVADLMQECYIPLADDDKLATIHNQPGSRDQFSEAINMAEQEFNDILSENRVFVLDPEVWDMQIGGRYLGPLGIGYNPRNDLIFRSYGMVIFTHEAAHKWAKHSPELSAVAHAVDPEDRDNNVITDAAISTNDFAAQLSMMAIDAGGFISKYHLANMSIESNLEIWSHRADFSQIVRQHLQEGPFALRPSTIQTTLVDLYNPAFTTFDNFGIDNAQLAQCLATSQVLESLREQYIQRLTTAVNTQ